ncbi:hypothetical protein SAMN05421678_101187 [Actinopolymorpha cephalotaxi]|uniref:Uncharacterized protein n=1 Tax=Actinopolymorpha cephalotaxi TaxID=504797 RepID=A0A1I2KBE6_9ACTN|nr:hypothetical protein [Actinopolymorpha cephalotaxi]NYH84417.1 hypothetical protein [Actinopolymorpha cephalotaxi]SFF64412.1 hypothetical protein SAMN05421678_101187 [Actinopolymorpha cephalotaxi]
MSSRAPSPDSVAAYAQPGPPPLVRGARSVVVRLAALLAADAGIARRNAWEAVCADRERRRQWSEAS